jgi:hypothetical protein
MFTQLDSYSSENSKKHWDSKYPKSITVILGWSD